MGFEIEYSCVSHIGRVRSINQDSFVCAASYFTKDTKFPIKGRLKVKKPAVFGVFDGMGGEDRGEVASELAVQEMRRIAPEKNGEIFLREYCLRANRRICDYARENSLRAMGTTAAILLFAKKEITLCNIGDSKIFRFADGKPEQISRDHVAISAYGTKPPLSQNLGIPPDQLLIEPYVSCGGYSEGDRYLICSDGLTDALENDEIASILRDKPTQDLATALVERALQKGGKDNVTVICIEIKKSKNRFLNLFDRQRGGKK